MNQASKEREIETVAFLSDWRARLGAGKTVKTRRAIELEAEGYETWLRTLAPRSFFSPFMDAHHEFWTVFWDVLQRRARGEIVPSP